MNTTKNRSAQSIFPAVRYRDAKKAITWLGSALGFEEHAVHIAEDGTVQHAELSLNGDMIMLGSGTADGQSSIYIALDTATDVDAAYARAKSAGADITRELNDTDYGSHEFGLRDPEGHGWSFGTYRPSPPAT